MNHFDQKFPPVLKELHKLEFDYADGDGIDFEPYSEFLSAEENADWIKAWTGNKTLTGAEYRIFGQDGTGGLAAFWLVRDKKPLLEQPIVFFGSEGACGVVASNFSDYLWLLAENMGPCEAIENSHWEASPHSIFMAFATKHAKTPQKTPPEILAAAQKEFPTFEDDIQALCQ